MSLTLEQAELAGRLAAGIKAATTAIGDLDTRIADIQERGIGARGSSMALDDGTSIHADMPLSTAEAVEMLGRYRTLLVCKRDAAESALAAITIA